MARTNKVEACMFCDCLPCECNKPAKKATPKKRAVNYSNMEDSPNVVDVQLPEPKSSGMREAMKVAAAAPPPKPQVEVESLDPEMLGALSILIESDILHPDEVAKYKDQIPQNARAAAWKERRRNRELAGKA